MRTHSGIPQRPYSDPLALGFALGSLTLRVEKVEKDLSRLTERLTRWFILAGLLTAGALTNLSAEKLGQLAAEIVKQAISKALS